MLAPEEILDVFDSDSSVPAPDESTFLVGTSRPPFPSSASVYLGLPVW